MSRGVIIVAYGERAREAAGRCLASLGTSNPGVPAMVVSDQPYPGYRTQLFRRRDQGARWPKLWVDRLAPWQHVLYLDADTRPFGDIQPLFEMLDDGWELVAALSQCQGSDWLWNTPEDDRQATIDACLMKPVLIQAGVMAFRRCAAVHALFASWRKEWRRFEQADQGAFLRALYRQPVRVMLLGRPWNGGAIIDHRFGEAR